MKHKICWLWLLLVGGISLHAQDLKMDVEKIMEQRRLGEEKGGVHSFVGHAQKSPKNLLDAIQAYEKDTEKAVRMLVCDLNYLVYSYAKEVSLKQEAVEKITSLLVDEEKEVRKRASGWLIQVSKQGFSEVALEHIRDCFSLGDNFIDENVIKLTGFLSLTDVEGVIHDLAEDSTVDEHMRWICYLALARMGDEYSIEYLLGQTESFEMDDQTIQKIFPDLIYTRQQAIFEYMFSMLNNMEKGCDSPDPEIEEKTICGYLIMEMLAPYVKNYPLKVGEEGLESENFTKDLQTVRKWYDKQRYNLDIITDTF